MNATAPCGFAGTERGRRALPAACACDEHKTREAALAHCNLALAEMSAGERVAWALKRLPGAHVLSSSFGAQAAVSLHLLSSHKPDLPVVFIDTGHHFPETYRFVDEMHTRLKLNLKVYSAASSAAWQEARHGQRWLQGVRGLDAYNLENKVEPMQRALRELGAGTWIAGLRRVQSRSRAALPFLTWSARRWKLHPVADWTDRDVYRYLKRHDLPYHPLWEKGYVSIGDVHTTRTLAEAGQLEQTRFFGLKRECGLHDADLRPLD